MKSEYSEADFAKGVKNPYFEKRNTKGKVTIGDKTYEVPIRRDVYGVFEDIASQNGVTPEIIMQHCLMDYAAELGKAAIDVIDEVAQSSTIAASEKSMMKLLSLISKMGIDTVNYIAKE